MKKILSVLLILFPVVSYARWATVDDAAYEFKSINHNIFVKKDGTSETTYESEVMVKNEKGREICSKVQLSYNENASKLKVIEAVTLFNGKEHKVDPKTIEDKPLASERQGFDQVRQVLIAFPKVEVGTLIKLKYQTSHIITPIKNNYATTFDFGHGEYLHKSTVKISSEIELKFKANDPEKALEIKQSKNGNLFVYEVNLVKPVYKEVVNEDGAVADPDNYTRVSFSSFNTWKDVANNFTPDYEKVLAAPLPALYEEIVAGASKLNSFIDKANYVTSQLNEKVHYHGDWKTVKGQFVARELKEVAKTRYGDCKDFSTGTVAMLRKLGFKANVALVTRGMEKVYNNEDLLPDHNSNHAIVRAQDDNGKVYWLDPTSAISMAQGTFPDIADRKVLTLSSEPSDSDNEMIPAVNPDHAENIIHHDINFNDDMAASFNTKMVLRGEKATGFTGAGLYLSPKAISDEVYKIFNNQIYLDDADKKSIKLPDLKSRIVNDLNIEASYVRRSVVKTTNLGRAFTLADPWIRGYLAVSVDQVGDVQIMEYPSTITRTQVLKNISAKDVKKLEVKISTPWLIAERTCNKVGHDLEVIENFKVLKSYIANKELKSAEFVKLKADLQRNFMDVTIVFD